MEQKYVLGIVAVAIVAVLGVSMISANGFGNGFMNSDLSEDEKIAFEEHRESMRTAIENKDYSAWEGLMEEKIVKMQERITEEEFNNRVERHSERAEFKAVMEELKASGDFSREDVEALKEQYGIEGKGFENGGKGMKGSKHGLKKMDGTGLRQEGCPYSE